MDQIWDWPKATLNMKYCGYTVKVMDVELQACAVICNLIYLKLKIIKNLI